MNTYEQLLEVGRRNLNNFIESGERGPTGIESLEGEFLDQIIALNDYIFTKASTNYPERIPNFQPFFIDAIIDTQLLNKTLDYELEKELESSSSKASSLKLLFSFYS